MSNISIKGIDKAELLAALFNGSKQQGLGLFHTGGAKPMTKDEAAEELKDGMNFDYLHGRVMKISLDGDELMTHLYNRDVGDGAAERIVKTLQEKIPA